MRVWNLRSGLTISFKNVWGENRLKTFKGDGGSL